MKLFNKTSVCLAFVALSLCAGVSCKKNYIDDDSIIVNKKPNSNENGNDNNGNGSNNGTGNNGSGGGSKEVDPTTGEQIKSFTFDVSAYDKFVYFSFEKGIVAISDEESQQYDGWDIAFHRTDIRTNSGLSSKIGAKGGAYETERNLLTQKVEIPSAERFEVDEKFVIAVYHTDEEGVQQAYSSANPVLTTRSNPRVDKNNEFVRGSNGFIIYDVVRRGAIVMDRSRMPPSIEFSNKVYILRSPKGQYAKMKITSYKRKPGTPMGDPGRLLTMEYVYPIK